MRLHGVLVLVAVATIVSACGGSPKVTPSASSSISGATASATGDDIPGVVSIPAADKATDQAHVSGKVAYATSPPTRGPHNPVWQNCGYYTKVVANENAVHALEHGAVWITYTDNVDSAARAKLAALAKANDYLLITLYVDNPAPFVLSAWGRQLAVTSIDDPRVAQFVTAYVKHGPEPGAPCSGALGIPPDRPSTLVS